MNKVQQIKRTQENSYFL